MPAKSKAQQHLMAAAEHGANFPAAKKLRASMTHEQLHDFAATKTHDLPKHAHKPKDGEAHAYNWRTRDNLRRGRS